MNLSGVTDVQKITVTLNGVTDNRSQELPDTAVSMSALIGGVTANKVVSNTDVASVKAQVATPVTSSNFRHDVNIIGTISNTDVSAVKAEVGRQLP